MAYKEGSTGLALLIGLVAFIALNVLFGVILWGNFLGGYAALVNIVDLGFLQVFTSLMAGFFIVDATSLIIAIIIPIVVGLLAGAIARGGAGKGFMAGFSAVTTGYYMWNLVLFVVFLAMGGAGALQNMVANAQAIILLLSEWLFIPILAGIFGGIGGAIMSAILASPAHGDGPMPPMTSTTIIQAPTPAAAPVIIQGSTNAAPATGASVICPSCRAANTGASTFCQSCGTRLKS
jgi:hypothetical protein